MEGLHQYLIGVTAAAIVCAIAKSVFEEKTVSGSMISLIAGIVMTVSVLSPVVTLKLDKLPELTADLTSEASVAVAEGKDMAAAERNAIITEQVGAYILDKAAAFGAALKVEVLMPTDGDIQPEGVILYGNVSPYAKLQLQKIIAEDIGIGKEKQQWIS